MSGFSQSEFEEMRKRFMETCQAQGLDESKVVNLVNSDLGLDIIGFIQRQLSDVARLGYINDAQHADILKQAEIGLFIIVYVKHYPGIDESVIDRDPLFISSRNLVRLLFTRVLSGRDRELAIEDMRSRQPVIPGMPRQ